MTTTLARMRQLIGTAADWAANDLVIGDGELAVERLTSGNSIAKVGNGVGRFSELPYLMAPDFVRPQDFGAVPGGVVDATAQIQQALDSGRPVLIDDLFLTTGNEIRSSTHLEFRGRGKLKLANGANRSVLQNINWRPGGWTGATYGIDHDITIVGLNIDGNQANQTKYGTGLYADEPVTGVRLFGITNLVIRDWTVFQSRNYAVWLSAIDRLTVDGLFMDQYMGGVPDNQDGLHIHGPARNLSIKNIKGTTNDDMVALNADDVDHGPNVLHGPITSALIEGVYPNGSLQGVRLLSGTHRMDQITVRTIKGSTRDVAVNQSPYNLGVGNVGSLLIEDIDCRCTNPFNNAGSVYYSMVSLGGVIDNATVRDIVNYNPTDNRSALLIAPDANIGVLTVASLRHLESSSSTISGIHPIFVQGRIQIMHVTGLVVARDVTLVPSGNALVIDAPGKGVRHLVCTDWTTTKLVIPIELRNGTLEFLLASGLSDRNALAGYPLIALGSADGSATAAIVINCQTDPGKRLLQTSAASTLLSNGMIDPAGLSGASARMAAPQAMVAAAYTKVNFGQVVYNRIAGEYAAGQFTVTQAQGTYLVTCSLSLTVPTNPTTVILALYKNGVASRYIPGGTGALAGDTVIGGIVQLPDVAVGDVYELRLYCSAVVTVKVDPSSVVSYERLK